ncbi:MAG: flagellar hook-associated protein FlgL [Sandaracinaceae bacterium]|nr:flagellar hook-associated protein 3 [Myxococcales bacterium]
MRVSDSMMHELATRGVTGNREALFDKQRIASSGLRVEKPSDDPVAAGLARGTKSRERRSQAIEKISGEAIDRLQAVDDTLGGIGDILSRARELAVQGANDHVSLNDRAAMATEVSALRAELLNLSNTKIEGEYVFSGLSVDRTPFDPTGAYLGETQLKEIEVGPGLRLPTQVSAAAIFGVTGGTNPFTALDDLEAALNANDGDAIHASIGGLATSVDQVANGRANAGAHQQALQQAQAAAARVRDEAIRRRATLTEADPVEAFTDLVKAESALQQALAIAARMPPPSLVEMGG